MRKSFLDDLTTPVCEISPIPRARSKPPRKHPRRVTVFLCQTAYRSQALLIRAQRPLSPLEIKALYSLIPEVAHDHPKLSKRWGYTHVFAHPDWAAAYSTGPAPTPIIHFTL